METVQKRFFRQMAARRTKARAEGRVERRVDGQVVRMLLSFRRTLAVSGLHARLARDIGAHVARVTEAARRAVRFDLDEVPDGARLMLAIWDGGGPEQVPTKIIWDLLPHIPAENTSL